MKILITGGKSARAFRLRRQYQNDQIVMADYGEMPQFGSAEYQFVSLGNHNADTTAHALLTFCLDNAIEAILPVNDFEIEAVVKSRILFEEFDIHVLTAAE
jgi:hypothetical protein